MKIILFLFANIYIAFCNEASDKIKSFGIVPDVIDIVPDGTIDISYPSGVQVNYGNELTPTQVKDEPTVSFKTDPNSFYLLVMTDPDAPSEKKSKLEVKHWLVGNIPGTNIKNGDVLADYRGSGPPQGSGLHRYIFLIYKQKAKINFDEKRIPTNMRQGRLGFNIRKFAEKYDLDNPIAVNFYQAQYDSYVEVLKQITVS